MPDTQRGRIPASGPDQYPGKKLEYGILHANRLLDERVLPGFLQDQLLLWTMEASGVLKEKAVSVRTSGEIKESDVT